MQEVCLSQETFISLLSGRQRSGVKVFLFALVILEETLICNKHHAIQAYLGAGFLGLSKCYAITCIKKDYENIISTLYQ